MKYIFLVVLLGVASYFAYLEMKPPPPPPPAPPIPAVPPCIVDNNDLTKVIRSASDDNADVRWQALKFLDKNWCDMTAQQVIFQKLRADENASIREKIAEKILARRTGRDVSQNLIWALKDPDPRVRVSILKALSQVGDYSAAPNVTTALKDPDENVRVQALKTLNDLQEKEIAAIKAAQEEARRKAQEEAQKKQQLGAGLW
ncbi:MAG: HEAT repeat domain-containing protein [Elusimicrobiota bacterium]